MATAIYAKSYKLNSFGNDRKSYKSDLEKLFKPQNGGGVILLLVL